MDIPKTLNMRLWRSERLQNPRLVIFSPPTAPSPIKDFSEEDSALFLFDEEIETDDEKEREEPEVRLLERTEYEDIYIDTGLVTREPSLPKRPLTPECCFPTKDPLSTVMTRPKPSLFTLPEVPSSHRPYLSKLMRKAQREWFHVKGAKADHILMLAIHGVQKNDKRMKKKGEFIINELTDRRSLEYQRYWQYADRLALRLHRLSQGKDNQHLEK